MTSIAKPYHFPPLAYWSDVRKKEFSQICDIVNANTGSILDWYARAKGYGMMRRIHLDARVINVADALKKWMNSPACLEEFVNLINPLPCDEYEIGAMKMEFIVQLNTVPLYAMIVGAEPIDVR